MTRKTTIPEHSRRLFLQQAAAGCLALGTITQAGAQTMVADSDAQATGYSAEREH